MSKYDPLAKFLADLKDDAWDAPFAEIEKELGTPLPPSARSTQSWWANSNAGHSQAKSWLSVGWKVVPSEVDLPREMVRFERTRQAGRRPANLELSRLREEAMEWSGITDPAELNRAALSALIRHEQAEYVKSLGGSMPDAQAAPRRRITW
jgi:hypothetical protein